MTRAIGSIEPLVGRAAKATAAALLFACFGLQSAHADTIIDFEAPADGVELSSQYHAQGVDFSEPPTPTFDVGPPRITDVGSGVAQSGTKVADGGACSGEFCMSALYGSLAHASTH